MTKQKVFDAIAGSFLLTAFMVSIALMVIHQYGW